VVVVRMGVKTSLDVTRVDERGRKSLLGGQET
jgi:hypothetical protein